MFSLHLAEKRERQTHQTQLQQTKQRNWLKKYNSLIKPKLLQRYDTRVNAFIRQLQSATTDKNQAMKHQESVHFKPFKFSSSPSPTPTQNLHVSMSELSSTIRRESAYVPLSSYQFRTRVKEKELTPKVKIKVLKYRKWHKEVQQSRQPKEDGQLSRMSAREFFRRIPQDNLSDIPSAYEDNQSLRFSVNDNIEAEARQYEKQQELVQKKGHFKRLANLQQVIQDPKAKRSIHELLVKGGFTRPKIRTQHDELEVDLLKLLVERQNKM